MKEKLSTLYGKDGTKKVLASLISILVGLVVGALVVVLVGLSKSNISMSGMWDGVQLIFAGIFSTGRDASGALSWGYNAQSLGNMLFRATPLIMTGLSVAVGVPLGLIAGYRRGTWEFWIMRLADLFQTFPSIVLILCLVALVGPSVVNLILVIGLLGWTGIARLVYGNTLAVREQEYIVAVQALGGSTATILRRNVLPNAVSPVWAALPLRVGRAILSESSLSFLGVGIRTPQASWGNLIQYASGLSVLTGRPWVWLPPGLCIVLTVLCLQFVGDGLRDAMDPRHRFISH